MSRFKSDNINFGLFAALVVIPSVIAFVLVHILIGFALNVEGDAYERRAAGADGICPVESWEVYEGTSSKVYACEDEAQRQAAAEVVAYNDSTLRIAGAVIAASVTAVIVVVRLAPRAPIRTRVR